MFRPRAAAKDDLGPAIRERWLELQRREPQLGRKALARRLPAEHTWLYRHDRAWLDAHSPLSRLRSPPRNRMNWAAVDQAMAHALRQTAEQILSQSPPMRVTLAELERQLGRPGWAGKRRAKLPETQATLADVTESVEAFRLRRIAWAREALERSEGSAPAWKVHRLAGLPDHLSEAVRHALDATAIPCQ
ncbi:TnsD family Tn7-like transposition protein [Azospirillum griseum]|uniref:TnsD family Tn7-like transposition protein n=1 Tax=Azospirillum griseum TaxID=2496639 RepID=UPI0013150C4F|nr:TnsD family Tn7-like transposition protein [Azospirillum griseum]